MDKAIFTNHFLIYQFVYVFLFISFIFIISAIFIKKKILKLICLATFSVFLAMGFSELSIISKNKSIPGISSHLGDNFFHIQHKFVNYCRWIRVFDKKREGKIYSNRDPKIDETIIYDSIYGTYYNGFRYTKSNSTSNENYIFLGCSFVFGSGLNDDQTLPYYFSKLMKFEKNVLNCGVNGRSVNTAISIVESDIINKFVSKDSQTKYFIYYMMSDHIYRNFRFTGAPSDNWRYKNNKWERMNLQLGPFNYVITRSRFFINIYHSALYVLGRDYCENYMVKSLKQIEEIVWAKYKAKFIIIIWQDFSRFPLFFDKLKKTDLDLVFLPESFNRIEYKIKKDGHPNAKANEETARILMNYINNKENKN